MYRRGRRRIAFRFYVLLVVAAGLFGYGVYVAADSLIQRTTVIESGNMGNQYQAEAVIVRQETLTDAEGLMRIKYHANEGQLVYKGNTIAEIYGSGYSQTDENKLADIRTKIKLQQKTLLASGYVDTTLNRLDDQVIACAKELELLVRGKKEGNLLNLQNQLQSAQATKQAHLKSKYATDQYLTNLYDSESTLIKKIETWASTKKANADCIVSFYTDGYENILNLAEFDTIPAAQVRSILSGEAPPMTSAQRGRTAVFREVRPNGWYLLLISHDSTWQPIAGSNYKVQLEGFDDRVIDATVSSFARSGNELLVRMTVLGDVRPVLNVRTARATVGDQYVAGLKVPNNAIIRQGGQTGVVLTSSGGLFVPVHVLYYDNNYSVIQSLAVGALSEGQKIRVF